MDAMLFLIGSAIVSRPVYRTFLVIFYSGFLKDFLCW